MKQKEKFVLQNDLVIPKGTEFVNVDGSYVKRVSGIYEALMANGNDDTISICVSKDFMDKNNITASSFIATEYPLMDNEYDKDVFSANDMIKFAEKYNEIKK